MDIADLIEHLYDLDRKDLRRLAYEALLISDGPDKIEGDMENAAVQVLRSEQERTVLVPDESFIVWAPAE